MDVVTDSGREERPQVSTRFSLGMEDKRTDAARDGRTLLVRSNSQYDGYRKKNIFSVQLTSRRVESHSR